jgi:hypothetical protein
MASTSTNPTRQRQRQMAKPGLVAFKRCRTTPEKGAGVFNGHNGPLAVRLLNDEVLATTEPRPFSAEHWKE